VISEVVLPLALSLVPPAPHGVPEPAPALAPRALLAPAPTTVGPWYWKAQAGLGLLESAEVVYEDGAATEGEAEFGGGFQAGVALGYALNETWALEVDFSYRTNAVDKVEPGLASGGDLALRSLLLNLVYRTETDWSWSPYLGVGFGVSDPLDIDLKGGLAQGSYLGNSATAQYFAGIERPLTDNLDLYFDLRFLRAFDPEAGPDPAGSATIESEYGHWGLSVGVRVGF
jgi:hypothetical protein